MRRTCLSYKSEKLSFTFDLAPVGVLCGPLFKPRKDSFCLCFALPA